jgi:hypothetical protein
MSQTRLRTLYDSLLMRGIGEEAIKLCSAHLGDPELRLGHLGASIDGTIYAGN